MAVPEDLAHIRHREGSVALIRATLDDAGRLHEQDERGQEIHRFRCARHLVVVGMDRMANRHRNQRTRHAYTTVLADTMVDFVTPPLAPDFTWAIRSAPPSLGSWYRTRRSGRAHPPTPVSSDSRAGPARPFQDRPWSSRARPC